METPKEHFNIEEEIYDRRSIFLPLKWNIAAIKKATVIVIGAGALGNEVLKNLALIGVGSIIIIDFDIIEKKNLAKSVLFRNADCDGKTLKAEIAAKRLKELNPEVKILTINGDLMIDVGLGLFKRADVSIGCVDNRLTRMWINRFCHWLNKSWVDGGIADLGGQVTVLEPGVSCYESNLSPEALANIRYRNSCVTRAKRYASAGLANTTPITSSVIGAMQVQEAMKIISKAPSKNSMAGQQFFYEGLSNEYMLLPYGSLKEGCLSHMRIEEIEEAKVLTHNSSIEETLNWLADFFKDPEVTISLHYELILEVARESGDKPITFVKPRPKITQADLNAYKTYPEEDVRIITYTSEIDRNFKHPELLLKDIGVPPLHILTVISGGKRQYVELTGDETFYKFL